MNRKTLKVEMKRILYLIERSVRDDFDTDAFSKQMAKSLDNKLSDQEIETYCTFYLSEEGEDMGFTKEDYEESKAILEEFRELYLPKSKEK